jgi:hypothetical protein
MEAIKLSLQIVQFTNRSKLCDPSVKLPVPSLLREALFPNSGSQSSTPRIYLSLTVQFCFQTHAHMNVSDCGLSTSRIVLSAQFTDIT